MTSQFCNVECQGEDHIIETTDDGDFILYNHDVEEEEARKLFGDKTSHCYWMLSSLRKTPDSALIEASYTNNVPLAAMALRAGADIDAAEGWAVASAAGKGHCAIVLYLIEAGARLTFQTPSPLRLCIIENQLETAQILLEAGADSSAITTRILEDLIINGNYQFLELLFSHEVNLHILHRNLLFIAAEYGRPKITKLLLKCFDYEDKTINTAAALANENGHISTLRILASA